MKFYLPILEPFVKTNKVEAHVQRLKELKTVQERMQYAADHHILHRIARRKGLLEGLRLDKTEKQQLLETIFDNLQDIVTLLNPDLTRKYVNPAFSEITGISFSNAIGKDALGVIHLDDQETVEKGFNAILNDAKTQSIEYRIIDQDGEPRWIHGIFTPVLDEQGQVESIVVIGRDITELKKLHAETEQLIEQLKTSNEKYKTINELLSLLLHVALHDLRSPYNGFLGLTGVMMSDKTLTMQEMREYAENLHESAKKGYELTLHIQEFVSLQIDGRPLEIKPVNLHHEIQKELDILSKKAGDKQINLANGIAEDLEVNTNDGAVRSIIRNLVNNAIKFSHKGQDIQILAYRSKGRVKIVVMDQGVGMDEETRSKIFGPDRHTTIGTGGESGTGIGLKIVWEYVQKLDGDVEVKSEKEKGTQFIVSLPVAGQEPAKV